MPIFLAQLFVIQHLFRAAVDTIDPVIEDARRGRSCKRAYARFASTRIVVMALFFFDNAQGPSQCSSTITGGEAAS